MQNSNKPTEENFKSITTKTVISQLYKSRDVITIALLRNTKLRSVDPLEEYCIKLTKIVNALAKIHNNLEEVPSSKYIEPTIHLGDMIYYVSSQRKLFKTKPELLLIDRIISLMNSTKNSLSYEED